MSSWWPAPEPVSVHFDLDADAARQALRDALHDERFGRGRRNWSFQGEVLQRRVSVSARWGSGSAELPQLTGAVVPAGSGSDFVGTIGIPTWARWLGVVAWVVIAADVLVLAYVLFTAVTGIGSAPHWMTQAIGSAVILPFAVVFALWRRAKIRREATPRTATEALTQWLTATAGSTTKG